MEYDVVIIGGGPAGYVSAIRAGQLGMKVALIEKSTLGGMCLNWGCIPTKALMESAKLFKKIKEASTFGIEGIDKKTLTFNFKKAAARALRISNKLSKGVEFLQNKNKVEIIKGEGIIKTPNAVSVNDRLLETKSILIATGSRPTRNFETENSKLIEIDDFLKLETLPENIGLYGEGPHIVELAQMLALVGVSVNFYNTSDKLIRILDEKLEDFLLKKLKKEKVNLVYNAKLKISGNKFFINELEVNDPLIINGCERKGIIPQNEINLKVENEFIETNIQFLTNFENIFAIGDVNGKSILAHAASAQGVFVINKLNGIKSEYNRDRIPYNIYTSPEIAVIGKSEKELKENEVEYKVGEFLLSANGKALAEGNSDGFVRIFSEPEYGEVLGVQIVAENATDMISEASMMLEIEGTVYDLVNIIHAHPTVSEVFMEAGADSYNESIHK